MSRDGAPATATDGVSGATVAGPSRAARAGALVAASTLAMALASALQAVLYLGEFGATARTDAFFAAFALYQVVGVFTQATRVSAVPLLVGERALGMLGIHGAMALLALPILIACWPLGSQVAALLAPAATGDAAELATEALRILGAAIALQMLAAASATVLGLRDRFEPVAGAYAGGALAGLVTFLAVRSTGELVLAWSMLAMAVVTWAWVTRAIIAERAADRATGSAGPGFRAAEGPSGLLRRMGSAAGSLLGRSIVYLVVNGFFLVTIALVGREGGAGATTVVAYAYLLASYLVAGTSTSVGISRAPDLVRGAKERDWQSVVADTVPHGYRYAAFVCAPVLAAGAVAAAPIADTILPGALSGGQPGQLTSSILLLAPWTVAALLVNFLIPGLFALGRERAVNLLGLLALAVHIAVSLLAASTGSPEAVIAALAVAPALLAASLLVLGTGERLRTTLGELTSDTLRSGLLAAAAFGGGALLAAASGLSALPGAVVALVVGGVVYLVGGWFVSRRVLVVLLSAGRGGAADAG